MRDTHYIYFKEEEVHNIQNIVIYTQTWMKNHKKVEEKKLHQA